MTKKAPLTRVPSRQELWRQAHQTIPSIHHLKAWCENNIPPTTVHDYIRHERLSEIKKETLFELPLSSAKSMLYPFAITHSAPLGVETNWSRDRTKVLHKIALRHESLRNINSSFYSISSRDSGIRVCNREITLFADDWFFVQRLALAAYLNGDLHEARHPVSTFNEDLERYAMTQLGLTIEQCREFKSMGLIDGLATIEDMAMNHLQKTASSNLLPIPDMDFAPAL